MQIYFHSSVVHRIRIISLQLFRLFCGPCSLLNCKFHYLVDKMEQVFVSMYHGMSVESNKETCRDLVEKIFFPPIWPNLIQLYRLAQHC